MCKAGWFRGPQQTESPIYEEVILLKTLYLKAGTSQVDENDYE
jgi:hypothetical protein